MATIHEHFKDWCKLEQMPTYVMSSKMLRRFFDYFEQVSSRDDKLLCISPNELEAFKLSGSKDIKFSFGSGIGVNVYYQDTSGNWVDITDYELW